MMFIKKTAQPVLEVGACFYQYQPKRNFAYCTGEVKSVTEQNVTVDFGDMEISFKRSDVTFIIAPNGDEHFMSIQTGVIVNDYRNV